MTFKSDIDLDLDLTLLNDTKRLLKPKKLPNVSNYMVYTKKLQASAKKYAGKSEEEIAAEFGDDDNFMGETVAVIIESLEYWYEVGREFWEDNFTFATLVEVNNYVVAEVSKLKKK